MPTLVRFLSVVECGSCMYVCISSKIRPQCGFSGFASIQGTGLMKRRVKQTHMLKEMNDECLNNARS